MTEEQQIQSERELAYCNLKYFRKRVCKYLDFQPFHEKLDNVLNSKSRYKRIMIPRNHLKSSAIMSWLLQKILKEPNLSVLYESSIYAQAKRYLSEMREHIESPRWVSLFGNWIGSPWTDSAITINRRTRPQPAPTISASGLDKAQTGQHYDIVILDDLVDELNSKTQEGREKPINRYKQALSLLRPGGIIIMIGTPWDEKDLYGWIDSNPDIAALFETIRFDIYNDDKSILFHQKFCETIAEEKLTGKRSFESLRTQLGPYQFSCQYRINATAEDFSEFKKSWLKHDSVDAVNSRLKKEGKIAIFCDPAMGKEATINPCDTAIIISHFMQENKCDVLFNDVSTCTPGDTVTKLHTYASKYASIGKDVEVFIEDVGFQGVLITLLEKKRSESGVYYQVTPVKPNGDKDRRIRGLFPYYKFSQITHSEAIKGGALEYQLCRFPKDRKKDAIDAWSQFVYSMTFPVKIVSDDRIDIPYRNVFSQRAPLDKKVNKNYSDHTYLGSEGEMFSVG